MNGKKFLKRIKLANLLSYGPESEAIDLEPLNVLIGPNGSGKSNLIEAISLLKAAPSDLTAPIRSGGGIDEWLWKGADSTGFAELEVLVDYPAGSMPLRYKLKLGKAGHRLELLDEVIENERKIRDSHDDVFFYYRYLNGHPVLNVRTQPKEKGEAGPCATRLTLRDLRREDLNPEQSVLSQRQDPEQFPELTYLGRQFKEICFYREWNLGRNTPPRLPQPADLRNDFLEESAKNLGLVLNNLQNQPAVKQVLLEKLREFYERVTDVFTRIQGGTVQIYFHEAGLDGSVPATRLSDGTLRYLCLLSILCHPEPPPLICLEEPELGLHPDVLPTIAELLVQASQRTQLVVTTHSNILVSELSEASESVIVCERDDAGTHLRRLDSELLKEWLEKYSLGELWTMGEIGGKRW